MAHGKKKSAEPRPRNPIFDTIVEVFGYKTVTERDGKYLGVASAELTQKGATPGEIRRRHRRYRLDHPSWELTPMSLAKYWDSLAEKKSRVAESNEEFLKALGVE